MASAFIKRPGQIWAKYKDRYGVWKSVPTGARTKKAALEFAQEKERTERRVRAGIDPDQGEGTNNTVGWMAQWWLDEFAPKLRSKSFAIYLRKYFIPKVGHIPLAAFRDHHVDAFLGTLEDERGLGAKTINDCRAAINRVFVLGYARGKWRGLNPVENVARRKLTKRAPHAVLRADEVAAFLKAAGIWAPIMATAIWMALRRGEIFALRKSDVNLEDRSLVIAHSHDADTTKGGHADVLPIPVQLVPYLEQAIRDSDSEFLFPDAKGGMRSRDTDMKGVVRRTMVEAGLVDSYLLRCFKRGCGHSETARTAAEKNCPSCGRPLWAKGIPRDVGFHGLRHSTATLLLKSGVPYAIVQRIMRHSDPRVTTGTYGHLDIGDMRIAMDGMADQTAPIAAPDVAEPMIDVALTGTLGAHLVPEHAGDDPRARAPTAKRMNAEGKSSGPSRIRTWDQSVMSRQL